LEPALNSDRRSFLESATRLLQAGVGIFLGIPFVKYIVHPFLDSTSQEMWSTVDNFSDIPVGDPQRRTFTVIDNDGWSEHADERTVWVVRNSDDQAVVFTAICPHQGCSINWRAAAGNFRCACHESTFNESGHRLDGPSPRDMDRLEYKVYNGLLLVKYQSFPTGTQKISQK
jgi:menaquinol-cytochrome c reductase iron-sulfur subunit